MNKKLCIFAFLNIFILLGCKTTAESVACDNSTNWFEVGEQTALNGKHVRTFEKFKNQCGDTLPHTAKSNYLDGYTKGIANYCTYKSGFDLAMNGLENPKVCPFEIRQEFEKGYQTAKVARNEKLKRAEHAERERARRLTQQANAPKKR